MSIPTTFPCREQWNICEHGFAIKVRYIGEALIDGVDCQCYEEYQDIPGRNRHLIAVIYAPFCAVQIKGENNDG